jgi:hypothetical protein
MQNKCVQTTLTAIYTDVSATFEQNKPKIFHLIDEHINWDEIIPASLYSAYYRRFGRPREYSLESLIKALVLQRIFGYTEDSQLLNTLRFSKEMREFCGFQRVPDASKITRFKQDFCIHLERLFDNLVELTEPVCREIDEELAACAIFDTTGIESYVSENNPKFMSSKLKQAKTIAKNNSSFDPYKGVYALLPDAATSNPAVKQQYINGHFCYAQKAVIITNGLGIVRHIDLLDEDFKNRHPECVVKRSDNPDLDKEIGDSSALRPTLQDFFKKHPTPIPTFIGDSAFDSYDNYAMLIRDFHFQRAVIPLNMRNSSNSSASFNDSGVPLCPIDSAPFVFLGKAGGTDHSTRFKWVCHKSAPATKAQTCTCENPCTTSPYGRCVYTYPDKNLRLYPGIARETEQWDKLYKTRVVVERSINSLKASFCVDGRKTSNVITTKADLFLAGIVQLLGVLIAKAIHSFKHLRRIRSLIA